MSKVVSNKRQLRRLVELLQKNQSIARGVCSKTAAQKKWEEFTIELNILGPPQREWHKWQRVWADLKCKIKKKKTENEAGGPQNKIHHFSDTEEAVIEMLDFSLKKFPLEPEANYDESMMSNESLISIEDMKFEPENFNEYVMKVEPPKTAESVSNSFSIGRTVQSSETQTYECKPVIENQHENPAQKHFFESMTDLMRDIKRSINNIEDHMRRDVQQKEELLELKRQKLKAYKEKMKSQRVDRRAKLKLQNELLALKRQKLSNFTGKQ